MTTIQTTDIMTYADYKKIFDNLNHSDSVLFYLFAADMSKRRPNYCDAAANANDARERAFTIASYDIQKKFNLERSYRENKDDVDPVATLKKDVTSIFWMFFRKEYPSIVIMESNPKKYANNVRVRYNLVLKANAKAHYAGYQEDRRRGAEKRYTKESNIRNRVGDNEFNKMVDRTKATKHQKGASNPAVYLKYTIWKTAEKAKRDSIYLTPFTEHPHVMKVDIPMTGVPIYTRLSYSMSHVNLMLLLKQVLKKYPVHLELTDAGFGNTPMQYVWTTHSMLAITSATRAKTRSGDVCYYAIHPDTGLHVCFKNTTMGFYRVFPKEFECFTDYTDPVTQQFVGNPKIMTQAHLLHSVKGHITATIKVRNTSITLSTGGFIDLKSVDQIRAIITSSVAETPMDDIEKRLTASIQKRHDTNKANGLKVKATMSKDTSTPKSSFVAELKDLVDMFEKGLLTDDEFKTAKTSIMTS